MKKILIILILITTSCASIKSKMLVRKVIRHHNFTERFIDSLFNNYNNAFYINYGPHITFSTVWTYTQGNIEVYSLSGEEVKEIKKIKADNFLVQLSKDKNFVLDTKESFPFVLDGEMLGYKIMFKKQVYEDDLPIDINSFLNQKHTSVFFDYLVNDIIKYNIKDLFLKKNDE